MLPAKLGLQRGDQVRIVRGPLVDRLAIFDGMKGSERAAVLLAMLGSVQRVDFPDAISRVGPDSLGSSPAGFDRAPVDQAIAAVLERSRGRVLIN